MKTEEIQKLLHSVIAGDIHGIEKLYDVQQEQLVDAAAVVGDLAVTREAVKSVLEALRAEPSLRRQAALWSDFVSFGVVSSGSADPVEIEWEPEDDKVLAEALFRLRELGDEVVPELTLADINELLGAL